MATFQRTTLSNGTRVLTAPMSHAQSVSCFVMFAAGSRYERRDESGVAHFAEHMRDALAALDEAPVSVRVGIHTGTPAPDPPKYVGIDVHIAARVMKASVTRTELFAF